MTRPVPAPRRALPAACAALAALLALTGCELSEEEKLALAKGNKVDAIAESNLGDVMLSLADSKASVEYFRRAVGRDPKSKSLRRGFALALARDGQNTEARQVFEKLIADKGHKAEDLTVYARVLARLEMWDEAEAALNLQPEGYATAREQQMRGMIADHRQDWPAADVHYETARKLAVQPAPIYNNMGVSLMARRDWPAAEAAFRQALQHDPELFEAKNNLALTYALRKRYALPVMPLTEEERAILLHNIAMVALRQGDREVALNLLQQSVDIHPRRWAPAAEKLAALKAEG